MTTDKIREIEARIADLKGRWPKHSVKPIFWQELEDLEGQLEAALREENAQAAEKDNQQKETKIRALIEQAKQTNDFIKFDRYIKQLHKLRSEEDQGGQN